MGIYNDIQKRRKSRQVLDLYHDLEEAQGGYRNIAFDNNESNYGWYECARCGRKFRRAQMDVDHILPQSKGGDDSRYNTQLLCQHCNRSKQADTTDTASDLNRRRKELKKQDKDDIDFLTSL